MASDPGAGKGERVRYRPLVPLEAAPLQETLSEDLAAIEDLEARLQDVLEDARVARRLQRELLRNARSSIRRTDGDGATGATGPGFHAHTRQQFDRYRALLDGSALRLPGSADELADLHGRVLGQPGRAHYRSSTSELPGRTMRVLGPDAREVPQHVDRVLSWSRDTDAHPAIVTSLLMAELLAIRPFRGAEDLLGRLLSRIVLSRNGAAMVADIALDGRLDLSDPDAVDRLAEAIAGGDASSWIREVVVRLREALEAVLDDARFMARHVDVLNERQTHVAAWFRQQNRAAPHAAWRFRDIHAAFPTVPPRTLKRDLATLRDVGILHMEGKLKSARYHYHPDE